MHKSIEELMHLGIDFGKDFDGFLEDSWKIFGIVGIKINEKSMLTSTVQFSRKTFKTNGFSMFFWFSATEVGSKN